MSFAVEFLSRPGAMALALPAGLAALALALLFLPLGDPARRRKLAGAAAAAGGLLLLAVSLTSDYPAGASFFSGALRPDPLASASWPLALMSLAGAFLISAGYVSYAAIPAAEYYFLMAASGLGLLTLAAAGDLLTAFVALELMSIPLYALCAARRGPAGAEAAYKYFLLGSFGSGVLVMGLALVFGWAGGLSYEALRAASQLRPPEGLALAGIVLAASGFAFKAALVPFHMWVPDVYEGAPAPVGAYMASAVKAGAVIALLRLLWGLPAPVFEALAWWLAFLSILAGTLLALPQTGLKRLLAYSSVGHAGYIAVAFLGGAEGAAAALFYLYAYAAATLGAFGAAAAFETGEKGADLDSLAGAGYTRPGTSLALTICLFSLAGIPPMAGFFGKFFAFSAALKAGYTGLTVFALAMSAAAAWFYLKVIVALYMRKPPETPAAPAFRSNSLGAALALAAAASLLLGFFSSRLLPFFERAASHF